MVDADISLSNCDLLEGEVNLDKMWVFLAIRHFLRGSCKSAKGLDCLSQKKRSVAKTDYKYYNNSVVLWSPISIISQLDDDVSGMVGPQRERKKESDDPVASFSDLDTSKQ